MDREERSDERSLNYELYGHYCNKQRQIGLKVLPFWEWKQEIRNKNLKE